MPKKWRRGLVETLKDAIRESGQSLNQISKATGVGSNQLSRFMRGERTLTLPVAEKLCDALGLRLVGERKARPRPAPKEQE
jgi:transcriptional regulator with XRE-family HTH domain